TYRAWRLESHAGTGPARSAGRMVVARSVARCGGDAGVPGADAAEARARRWLAWTLAHSNHRRRSGRRRGTPRPRDARHSRGTHSRCAVLVAVARRRTARGDRVLVR